MVEHKVMLMIGVYVKVMNKPIKVLTLFWAYKIWI